MATARAARSISASVEGTGIAATARWARTRASSSASRARRSTAAARARRAARSRASSSTRSSASAPPFASGADANGSRSKSSARRRASASERAVRNADSNSARGAGARSGLLGASGSAASATACASSARSRARAKRCASQLAHRGGSPGGGVAPPEARRADARWEAIVASISSSAAIAGWSDAAAAMRIVEDERRTRSADQEARGMSDRIRIPLERFAPRFRFRSRRGTRRASGKGGALVGASSRESRRRLATPWGGRGRV